MLDSERVLVNLNTIIKVAGNIKKIKPPGSDFEMGLGPKLGGLSSLRTNSPSTNPSAKVGTIFGNARPNPVDRNLFGAESSCLMLRNGYKAMICSSVSPVTAAGTGTGSNPPPQSSPPRDPCHARPRSGISPATQPRSRAASRATEAARYRAAGLARPPPWLWRGPEPLRHRVETPPESRNRAS